MALSTLAFAMARGGAWKAELVIRSGKIVTLEEIALEPEVAVRDLKIVAHVSAAVC